MEERNPGRIDLTKAVVENQLGINPSGFEVMASDGGMTLKGRCTRCGNSEKIVDISPDGTVEVLNCSRKSEDCLL